jgi:ubiquinone/menaquinone biosynthesis methyltransferase
VKLSRAFDTPQQKQRYVRQLFATIADRYDLITILLSFGRDRAWKRRLVRLSQISKGQLVLDLACGTGDIAFEAASRGASVVGIDVTMRMVELARDRARRTPGGGETRFLVGDMMDLPTRDGVADVVTTGYGLRNVPVLEAAIAEAARVLKPGGRLVSLDFNRPRAAIVRVPYLMYLSAVGSLLGWLLHRDPDTYRYIPESLRRYPGAHGVAELLRAHGFTRVEIRRVFGGLLTIHVAFRR